MILVTGLSRSGTSLSMQIMEALGCSIVMDQVTDQYNPDGYFEGPHTLSGINSRDYSSTHCAKVMISALGRCSLNDGDKVILCLRNPSEVAYSQAKDSGKFGSEQPDRNMNAWFRGMQDFLSWKSRRPVFVVDYAKLLISPEFVINGIAEFCGIPTNTEIASLVKTHEATALYHEVANGRF